MVPLTSPEELTGDEPWPRSDEATPLPYFESLTRGVV